MIRSRCCGIRRRLRVNEGVSSAEVSALYRPIPRPIVIDSDSVPERFFLLHTADITAYQITSHELLRRISAIDRDKVIKRQVGNLPPIDNDLLGLGGINSDNVTLAKSCLKIQHTIARTLESSVFTLQAVRHQLSIRITQPSLMLCDDPMWLARALSHRLHNAENVPVISVNRAHCGMDRCSSRFCSAR